MASQIKKQTGFVIMPFSGSKTCTEEQWTETYQHIFHPAITGAGLNCERAVVGRGNLIKSILENLQDAYIVFADITDANPNVFYELGVRHTLSRRTVLLVRNPEHIPSDLRGYWSLVYDNSPAGVSKFATEVKRLVNEIHADPERNYSPVSDFLERDSSPYDNTRLKDGFRTFMDMTRWRNSTGELMTAWLNPYPIHLAESAIPGMRGVRIVGPHNDNIEDLLSRVASKPIPLRNAKSNNNTDKEARTPNKEVERKFPDGKPDFYMQYEFKRPLTNRSVVKIMAKLDPGASIDLLYEADPQAYQEGVWFRYIREIEQEGYVEPGHARLVVFNETIASSSENCNDWKTLTFDVTEFEPEVRRGLRLLRVSPGVTISHWELE